MQTSATDSATTNGIFISSGSVKKANTFIVMIAVYTIYMYMYGEFLYSISRCCAKGLRPPVFLLYTIPIIPIKEHAATANHITPIYVSIVIFPPHSTHKDTRLH